MQAVWSRIVPSLPMAAYVAVGLVALLLIGLVLSPLLMRRPRARPGTRGFGCILYYVGLWVFVRFVGAVGVALCVAAYLWEKGKDSGPLKKPVEEFQNKLSVAWFLIFIGVIGLLALLGEKLRQVSEKHEDIARKGWKRLFESCVPSTLPSLGNNDDSVLAYRAVYVDNFNTTTKNISGWTLEDLHERIRLIYFAPSVKGIQPSTALAGATVTVTGTGFTEARAVYFGSATALSMTVNSDTQLTAAIPPGKGAVPVTVISKAGVISASSTFTYQP